MTQCPCGSNEPLDTCCLPILRGDAHAPTAEALMRSRYTAHVMGDYGYLGRSLLPEKQSTYDAAETMEWSKEVRWTGLEILHTKDGGPGDKEGVVEFSASFEQDGQPMQFTERGRFKQREGRWYYVDGRVKSGARTEQASSDGKVGRNQPCPCGSGKKFKKCCGR